MRLIDVVGLCCVLVAGNARGENGERAPQGAGSAARAAESATRAAESAKPSGGAVSAASVEIRWTGGWHREEAPVREAPLYAITNKATAPLTYLQLWHYFYDDGKVQLGRAFSERYQLHIAPNSTQEVGAGPDKSELPAGTTYIEAVVMGANFGSEANKFRDPQPAEQRAFGAK
jgi:hypothetical protein